MEPATTPSRKTQLFGAFAAIATGVFSVAMIHFHPEGLRAPAWVAYLAGSVFVLAGLALLAGAFKVNWLQQALGMTTVLALLLISGWIALGPGERVCAMSIDALGIETAGIVCRGAFGFGALLTLLLLALMVWRALRRGSSPP